MPVCIAGMHRSGTSMITRLLHRAGLHLGSDADFIPPSPDNAEGYMENKKFVAVNDELLLRCGGSYLNPPALTPDSAAAEDVFALRDNAEAILREFVGREPWGWKDPRNSLTLPFWTSLIRGVKVVICLRHPSDVARSLYRGSYLPDFTLRNIASFIYRGKDFPDDTLNVVLWQMYPRLEVASPWSRRALLAHPAGLKLLKIFSQLQIRLSARQREMYTYRLGFTLWQIYNERILKFTTPAERIITHYESYFYDPRAELRRVLDFLCLSTSDETIAQCCSIISPRLRHHQSVAQHPANARAAAEVFSLYAQMCAEAGFTRHAPSPKGTAESSQVR